MASVGAGDKDLRAHLHRVVFMIWRQHRNGAPGEHREEETNLGLLGKAWKRSGLPDKALCAAQGHSHLHGQISRIMHVAASRLL